ncbi:hypothetical protein HDV63DRAFT_68241 [Trichoderma sp. SZMC 28014]
MVHLAAVFPTDDWENRKLWQQYLPHALRILQRQPSNMEEQYCSLGFWVSRCLRADGRTKEAIALLEHVVAIREKNLAEDNPDRLASQHALAGVFKANGQTKEAMTLLEHVVTIEEKSLAEDHSSRLASQLLLATLYFDDGQAKEARQLVEHVVAIQQITLAEDHPHRLASENLLRQIEMQK